MRFDGANLPPFYLPPRHTVYTDAQLRGDALWHGFAREAASLPNLLTLGASGLSYQFGRTLAGGILGHTSYRLMPRLLAPLVGLNFEVATLQGIHYYTGDRIATEADNRYRSYFSTLLDIGSLKALGFLSASFSEPTRQLTQSVGMVSVHRLVSATGLLPSQGHAGFIEDVANAQVLNLEMGGGAVLLRYMGGSSLTFIERSMRFQEDLRAQIPLPARPALQGRFSGAIDEGVRRFAKGHLESWMTWQRPSPLHLRVFELMFKSLEPAERLQKFRALFLQAMGEVSAQRETLLLEAMRRAYGHMGEADIRSAAALFLEALPKAEGAVRSRLFHALRDAFPSLGTSDQQAVILQMLSEMVLAYSPAQGAARTGFFRSMSQLPRERLFEVGAALRCLHFHPIESLEVVKEALEGLSERFVQTRSSERCQKEMRREADFWASLLAHEVFRVGQTAHDKLISLLSELPEAEARHATEGFPEEVSESFLTNLRWAEEHERRRTNAKASEPAWIREWESERAARILEELRRRHTLLRPPAAWDDLGHQARSLASLQDIARFRELLRARFVSPNAAERATAELWWGRAGYGERWLVLQACVGSRSYWRLKGEQALRLRSLASLGLENETGIAAKRAVIREEDDVLFVLGNAMSVGIPQEFAEEVGLQEAGEYLMVHHTHPSRGPGDFNQIYFSTHVEGGGSGDLFAMFSLAERHGLALPLAFSVTHEDGGNIFVLREEEGRRYLDSYAARRGSGEPFSLSDPRLQNIRRRAGEWALGKGVRARFWEIPFDAVEAMRYPSPASGSPPGSALPANLARALPH